MTNGPDSPDRYIHQAFFLSQNSPRIEYSVIEGVSSGKFCCLSDFS